MNKLKIYIGEDENNKNSNKAIQNSNLKKIEKSIKHKKNIYIPFIRISNNGKSIILNFITGFQLFPESEKECITRGIIIKYRQEVELYEVTVQSKKFVCIWRRSSYIEMLKKLKII